MELGSRPRPGNDQEKGHLRHQVQDLHRPRVEARAAVFDQERQDRPPGHAQRCGPQKDRENREEMKTQRYETGMVGLGVMGRNLLLNMADHEHSVAGYDKDAAKVAALRKEAENLDIRGAESL